MLYTATQHSGWHPDLSFDEKRYVELSKQANLIALVESMQIAQKECLEIREKILGLKGFQFND